MPQGIDPSIDDVRFMNAHLKIRDLTVSVSFGKGIYGSDTLDVSQADAFEVAVFDDEGFIPITTKNTVEEQVAGWQSKQDVNKLIDLVYRDYNFRSNQELALERSKPPCGACDDDIESQQNEMSRGPDWKPWTQIH